MATAARTKPRRKPPAKKKSKAKPKIAVTTPVTPEGLGSKAEDVWRDTVDKYELRGHELRILEDACREVDLIERMQTALAATPLIVEGSQGQPVESPLVKEIRQHRVTYQRLVGALKLPEEDEPASSRSTSARAAAMARWNARTRGSA